MAGHNKWSKIKRKKGAEDAKRSKMFSKIIKEITVAVREGGPDPDANPRLRLAVANAKGINMPKDNVQRAIKKASESGGESYQEVTFEGYAPGGIAIFVECTTDNNNRTVANVRSYFTKSGGNLGTNGSVEFMFDRKGIFSFAQDATPLSEDDLTLELIDVGAEDVELEDGYYTVTTEVADYGSMQKKLEELKIEPESTELQRIPQNTTILSIEDARKVLRLVDLLEDDEDVQAVYHNMELTDEVMSELV